MAGGLRLLAHMSRQGFARPQFSSVAQVFGLGAGQMHHPSFVGTANDRFLGPMKGVFERGFHPHPQGLMQAMIDRNPADF